MVLVNHCLVRPQKNLVNNIGLKSANFVNPQFEAGVWGEVIEPPSILVFNKMPKLTVKSQENIRRNNLLHRRSLQFSPTIKLKKGDQVLYNYIMQVDNEEDRIGDCLLIPYDYIYCIVRQDQVLCPNGYILIERIPLMEDIAGMKVSTDKYHKGYGKIRYIGPKCKYLDGYKDNIGKLKHGDYIFFDEKMAVRVEWPLYNKLNKGKHPLIRIQHKDVLFRLGM